MDRRRLNGLIALFVLIAVVAALTYFDVHVTRQTTETVAFAPAQSADESAAPSETPVEPEAPAFVAETPAATPPATEAPATSPEVTEAAPAAPLGGAAPAAAANTDVAMADSKATEPQSTLPVMPGKPVVPTFDVVRVEPTGDAVIAGQAEPETKVEVLDGAAPIATAEANANGEWAIALDKPLVPGSHDLSVRTTSKDKTTSMLSDQRVTVSVPEKGSSDVLVVLNTPDAASKVLEVPGGTPAEGKTAEGQVAATERPAAEEKALAEPSVAEVEPPVATESPVATEPKVALEAPVVAEPAVNVEPPIKAEPQVVAKAEPAPLPLPKPEITVAAVEADTSGSLYIAGTAATGQTVRIYIDGKAIGDAQPSPSGTWLVETTRDMPAGHYTVRADQVDATGNVVARSEVPFEREIDVAVLKPTGTASSTPDANTEATLTGSMPMETVIIKKGDNLWRIARGAWGKGVRWSTIYQANTEQIRNPHWIYPGQVFVMPKGNATWTD
jgi:nucleoid-associated protein YgaU